MWVTSAVTARLKSGHDSNPAQIQEKKERRNQKESEKASSTWLCISSRRRRDRARQAEPRPPDTHTPVCPPTCSALVLPPLVGQAEKNELIKSERSRDAPLLNEKPDTVLALLLPS